MLTLKTVTIGKSTVGKTTIVTRLIHGHSDEKVFATIGASFLTHKNKDTKYNIWDTAGQERFHSLMPMYFRDAKIMLFVFDVSDMSTLNNINKYLSDLNNIDNYLIIILGNKIDLVEEHEMSNIITTTKEILKNSPIEGYIFDYVFISALTGQGFEEFIDILDRCAQIVKKGNVIFNKPVTLEKTTLDDESYCRC